MVDGQNLSPDQDVAALRQIASEVADSNTEARSNLSALQGRDVAQLVGGEEILPEWAARHIEIHKHLEKAVNDLRAKGEEGQIPEDVVQALKDSKGTMVRIANNVNYSAFLKAVLPDVATVDQHGMLKGEKKGKLEPFKTEWQLNLGLLMNVYNRTKDPAMKKQIEFLALNYLAKAAPIDLKELGLDESTTEKFEELFQLGVFQEVAYHRETSDFGSYISDDLRQVFPQSPFLVGNTFITDTTEYQELLPLFFTPMDTPNRGRADADSVSIEQKVQGLVDGWSNNLRDALVTHFQKYSKNAFNEYIDPPIIADLTDLIGEHIQTNGDQQREEVFEGKMRIVEEGVEKAIERTIKKINKKHPELCKSPDDQEKIRVFLKFNIACICRSKVKGVGVLKSVQLFMDTKHYILPQGTTSFLKLNGDPEKLTRRIIGDKVPRANNDLVQLVNYSGIRLGGVSAREKIFNFTSIKQFIENVGTQMQMTEYLVSGPNVVAFERKDDIFRTAIFQRLKSKMGDVDLAKDKPQVAILGKATVDIFEGLLKEIPEERWQELNANPDTRMLLQQSLFRAMQHMAAAENNMDHFNQFAQGIELIQSEIATILALTSPFKEGDFQEIYTDKLDVVPQQFRDYVKAGVAKSAMNTFIGVNAVVKQMNPALERVHGDGTYFEEVAFLGQNRSTREVMENNSVSSVDLYVGEFNHNIDIHLSTDNYRAGNINNEIRQILTDKRDTKHLTVAVDVTIDFFNSPHVKELLEEFSKEIEEGKLNFVFFRSGQKFDMLGMDNYYGGPFWIINNGGGQWSGFDRLTTSNTYKTDPLSMQWFCLANKYASKSLDDYRGQIFHNARSILNEVPADLKTGGKFAGQVRISTVDEGMQPSFVDIKVLDRKCGTIVDNMKQALAARFAAEGVKMHQRSSFGFYHANWNVIPAFHDDNGVRNVRINPGLNPEENRIILDFIKNDIPAILEDLNSRAQL